MKIAYLLSHVPGPRFYKKMKKAREEFEVSVVYRNRHSETFQSFFNDRAIERHELMNESLKAWKIPVNIHYIFFKKALTKLSFINPDIVHCGNLDMLVLAVMFKKRQKKNIKIVYEIGDLNKRTYNNSKGLGKVIIKKLLISLEKKMFKYVDELVISSQYFWDEYYKDFIPIEKVLLFPNAPEKEVFSEVKDKKNNVLTIGFIGRVRYFPQLKMLVDVVFEINKNNNKKFKVLIAGVGPDSEKLLNHVKKYDFVEMYGAYNYDKEIAEIYSRVDLVYSVYDAYSRNVQVAIPNRLYEAIVSEKPIIVAKNTKLSEFVIENQVGYAVGSNDSQDLFELLNNINIGNVDLTLIKSNCHKIKDNYYLDDFQNKLTNLYKSLITSNQ